MSKKSKEQDREKQKNYLGAATQSEDEQPPDEASAQQEQDESQSRQIVESGSLTHRKGKHVIHCLTIVGQVEGHYILPSQNKTTKYEHVIPQLVAIEEDPSIEGLIIILNTVGGDVEAGLAIAELIAGMKKPTVSLVLGGGHSIGVPLAVSAKRSFIVPSASMTVHPVRMNGLVLGVPQTLSYFDRMQDRIVRFVCDNSKVTPKKLRALMMNSGQLVMDIGTVLDGEAAVREGLIDAMGDLHTAIEELYRLIEDSTIRRRRVQKPQNTKRDKNGGNTAGRISDVRKKTAAPPAATPKPTPKPASKPAPKPASKPASKGRGRPKKQTPEVAAK